MKNPIFTPPPQISTQDMEEIPDYFYGRLIYYDASEAMRYVVYDGCNQVRFVSRAAAEKWCIEMAASVENDALEQIMRAQAHTVKAQQIIDAATSKYPYNTKEQLQLLAVGLHRIADKLDTIASQYLPKT